MSVENKFLLSSL